jgi:hypothetical protein
MTEKSMFNLIKRSFLATMLSLPVLARAATDWLARPRQNDHVLGA